jgi:uncharacterized protein YndB with AHSA1/START domain
VKNFMKTRTITKEIVIDAPAEAVWEALTTAEGLTRWFPLEARVEARVGAPIFVSWGPQCEGTGRVDAVEHGKRFRWLEPSPPAPGEPFDSNALGVVVEWQLEARGGKTLVRLVHSGIAAADWAREYHDALDYGWGFMLANLRLYLERHRGRPRLVAWPRKDVALSRADAWQRLLDRCDGLRAIAALKPGERFTLNLQVPEKLEGAVEFMLPPRGFCLRLANWNDALLWLSLEGSGEKTEVGIWLSAYDVARADVQAFEHRWLGVLGKAFE